SSMVRSITPYLTVDESLDAETLVSYGLSMNKMRPSNISSFTIPNADAGTTPAGASVVWPDEDALAEMRKSMREGSMEDYVEGLEIRQEEHTEDATDESGEQDTTEPGEQHTTQPGEDVP